MPSGPAAVAVSLKRRTQDAWGVARGPDGAVHAAWVIDGATPLGAADRRAADDQVARFAWLLSAGLRSALSAPPGEPAPAPPITEAVETARAGAQRSIGIGWPGAGIPTATLALIRRIPQGLESFVLGDSPLWIEDGEQILERTDPQFAGNEERVLRRWRGLRDDGLSAEDAYTAVLQAQARERTTRSTDRGLWILGESPLAAAHGQVRLLPGAAPRRTCLLTDGLQRVVDPFGLTDRRGLFEALHRGRAGELAQRLRCAERADSRRVAAPRLTTHDDVTGVAITL